MVAPPEREIDIGWPDTKENLHRLRYYYEHPGETQALATGFAALDFHIGGGLEDGELTIVAARPAMGKTALATCIADNVAQRITAPPELREQGRRGTLNPDGSENVVVIFTQEMAKGQFQWRWAGTRAGVSSLDIKRGQYQMGGQTYALEEEKYFAYSKALKEIARLPVLITGGTLTTAQMRRALLRVQEQGYRPRLVVDDYLGLHSDTLGGDNPNVRVGAISRNVKEISLEFNVPVLALHQLSRAVERRDSGTVPQLSDLRDSGNVEQDADNVWFPHRPEYYVTDKASIPPKERGKARLYIAKARNGEPGVVDLRYLAYCTRFEDWT